MSETVRLTDDLCLGRSDGGDGGQSAKAASGLSNTRYTKLLNIAMKAYLFDTFPPSHFNCS